jgi:hypothetical protein
MARSMLPKETKKDIQLILGLVMVIFILVLIKNLFPTWQFSVWIGELMSGSQLFINPTTDFMTGVWNYTIWGFTDGPAKPIGDNAMTFFGAALIIGLFVFVGSIIGKRFELW